MAEDKNNSLGRIRILKAHLLPDSKNLAEKSAAQTARDRYRLLMRELKNIQRQIKPQQ